MIHFHSPFKISFGKYKGKPLSQVVETDQHYTEYLYKNGYKHPIDDYFHCKRLQETHGGKPQVIIDIDEDGMRTMLEFPDGTLI